MTLLSALDTGTLARASGATTAASETQAALPGPAVAGTPAPGFSLDLATDAANAPAPELSPMTTPPNGAALPDGQGLADSTAQGHGDALPEFLAQLLNMTPGTAATAPDPAIAPDAGTLSDTVMTDLSVPDDAVADLSPAGPTGMPEMLVPTPATAAQAAGAGAVPSDDASPDETEEPTGAIAPGWPGSFSDAPLVGASEQTLTRAAPNDHGDAKAPVAATNRQDSAASIEISAKAPELSRDLPAAALEAADGPLPAPLRGQEGPPPRPEGLPPSADAPPPVTITLSQATGPSTAMTQPSGNPALPILSTARADWPIDLADRLLETASLRSLGTGGLLEIRLDPDMLGPVSLRLEVTDGTANVAIVTQTPEAARLFAENQHRLAEALARAGLDLGQHSAGTDARGGQPGREPPAQDGPAAGPAEQPHTDTTARALPRDRRVDLIA